MTKSEIMSNKTIKKNIREMMEGLGYRLIEPMITSPCDRFASKSNKYTFEFWYPVTNSDRRIAIKMSLVGNHSDVLTYKTEIYKDAPVYTLEKKIKWYEDAMDTCLYRLSL